MKSLGWALIQYDWCRKKGEIWTQRNIHTQGELHVKMKAEILVMFLKAKEGQR